ncbi:MAG: hypothetical protein QG656_1612 [Candidatus Hydrogenedentes bacterium]|nr:hypothetical protein [Candidatus Hydrogenedentota bacterium]
MKHPVFAMDTYFYNTIGSYPYDVRCEMLRELGYDATYLTMWSEKVWQNDLAKVATTKEKYGLDIAAVYAPIDIAAKDDDPFANRVVTLPDQLPDGIDIELNINCSDKAIPCSSPDGDGMARRWLEPLLDNAKKHGSMICLYPHFHSWFERVEDGVRLCGLLGHPNLKVVFCGFHWRIVDGKDLPGRIAAAAPHLRAVNMCGASKDGWPIEPLDCGEMDNFALLGLLHKHGYTGRIGFQGYSIGGDAYAYLKRSLATFREMEDRLERHPGWADLDF